MGDKNVSNTIPNKPPVKQEKLSYFDREHMRIIEEANRKRVQTLLKTRRANRITITLASLFALSIYGYTIYAMKQETFLDDFDEPEKIHD